jgi:hypothetical protein
VLARIGMGNETMKKTSEATQKARTKNRKESASDPVSLSSRAQKHVSVAIDGLVNIMRTCKSDSLRVSAINMLLDRGYGKPPQSLDVAIWDPVPLPEIREDMTLAEMIATLSESLKRLAPPRR